jgi:hypothetical protein
VLFYTSEISELQILPLSSGAFRLDFSIANTVSGAVSMANRGGFAV